jgi:hypothetical protein
LEDEVWETPETGPTSQGRDSFSRIEFAPTGPTRESNPNQPWGKACANDERFEWRKRILFGKFPNSKLSPISVLEGRASSIPSVSDPMPWDYSV